MICYKFKLYHSKKTKKLGSQVNICAEIWNHCIALHRRFYRRYGRHLNKFRLHRHLTRLKKFSKFHHWNSVNSQTIQEIADRIEKGYQAFFAKDNERPPTFRSKQHYKSFTMKNSGWSLLKDNRIRINGIHFKYHKSRDIEGKLKIMTIKRNQIGDWFIYIVTDHEASEPKPKTGRSAGFDFGCMTFLTGSDGSSVKSPLFFKQSRKQIASATRSLKRKVKGSANYKKAKIHLARTHEHITNQRDDWQWKTAKNLVETYDLLCFETLNMKSMAKKHGRKVHDLGFSDFLFKTKCLCNKHGKRTVQTDRWLATSKLCSVCGHKHSELQEWERSWTCPKCRTVHDRDFNAATNIYTAGTSAVIADDVRLAQASCRQS